ncbi:MAG: hypothetical protein EA379_09165 [Phycisphaerales bacterium]|nr:MAG: hypothetical protein EA379_09165 [Phycisphaerales bacterium]
MEKDGYACPLGARPVDLAAFAPLQGYRVEFEPADGDDEEGEWEEWPDRYMFDVVITHTRVEALARACYALLPGRVYPILDILGNDEYREVDPYIAYDAVGIERFIDALRRHRGWFYDDGMVGFGAMSIEPFVYIYVDEHKILTIRVEVALRERVEKILQAFDLQPVEEPLGVDSVEHEHLSALVAPEDRPDLLMMEEIIDELRSQWRLELNIDPDENVDDDGAPLGVTCWRCVAGRRREGDGPEEMLVVLLAAPSLSDAERLTLDTLQNDDQTVESVEILAADRITPGSFAALLGREPEGLLEAARVWDVRRVDDQTD